MTDDERLDAFERLGLSLIVCHQCRCRASLLRSWFCVIFASDGETTKDRLLCGEECAVAYGKTVTESAPGHRAYIRPLAFTDGD